MRMLLALLVLFVATDTPILDAVSTTSGTLVITKRAVVRLDETGRVTKTTRFATKEKLFPAVIVDETTFAGLGDRSLLLLAADGRITAEVPAEYATELAAIDLAGGGRGVAMELPRAKQIVLVDARGRTRGRASFRHYISAMRALGEELYVATYPDERRGTTLYRVRVGEEPHALHSLRAIGDFDILPRTRQYVTIDDDAVELRALDDGAVARRLPLRGAGWYRNVHAVELENGALVVALDGSGGRERSRIVAWSPSGAVLHDETVKKHTHAVRAAAADRALIVDEGKVWVLTVP
ncbi:MAG TPA: hypothetical protein VF618_09495 [Thermoanaerobaculia bacterium]